MELGAFAAHLAALTVEIEAAKAEVMESACKVVETEAKRVIGTYDYGWPQLADSTQADRERQGFSPNDPLLRTGEMRDSIEHTVVAGDGFIGSNDPKAKWQELGTDRIPARSFLAGAAAQKGDEVADMVGRAVHAVLIGGKAADVIR